MTRNHRGLSHKLVNVAYFDFKFSICDDGIAIAHLTTCLPILRFYFHCMNKILVYWLNYVVYYGSNLWGHKRGIKP